MINWIPLESEQQLTSIVERSNNIPCLIFKHSTRCEISAMAKHRLERHWDFKGEELEAYYLDLISFRTVSNTIAEKFNVYHESPQALTCAIGLLSSVTSNVASSDKHRQTQPCPRLLMTIRTWAGSCGQG